MKINRIYIASAVILLTCLDPLLSAAPASNQRLRRAARPIPGEYIVVLKEGSGVAATSAPALAQRYGGAIKHSYSHALSGFSVRMSEERAAALSQDPNVAYVEENGRVEATDIEYNAPWGLDRLDQRDTPLSGTYNNNSLTGSGVTVYVIDTGIRVTHQEFGGRASIGADFVGDGLNGDDGNGHGTHVAATIGGATYGVAKQVSLRAVRVLDSNGHGTVDSVIAGIEWVTAHHSGPSVANMSLGGSSSESEDQALRNSISSGVVYVVAAGNSNTDASQQSPARVAEAITVGATDSSDYRASFSNYGSVVDLFAPGVDITSAWNNSDSATNTISGTSMASPHVAGLAALRLQRYPSESPNSVQDAIKGNVSPGKVLNAGLGTTQNLAYVEYNPPSNVPFYKIVSVNSGRVLDVIGDRTDMGTEIDQWDYVGATSQQWILDSVGNGAYKITNVNSGKVLDVEGDSVANGAHVDQWDYVGYNSQHWTLTSVGNGAYKITNVNSGKALDVTGDSVDNGAPIDQWDYVGYTSQQWYLVQVN